MFHLQISNSQLEPSSDRKFTQIWLTYYYDTHFSPISISDPVYLPLYDEFFRHDNDLSDKCSLFLFFSTNHIAGRMLQEQPNVDHRHLSVRLF